MLVVIAAVAFTPWSRATELSGLPLFAWFLAKDQRDLQRLIAVFIDELASEMKLKKIEEKK